MDNRKALTQYGKHSLSLIGNAIGIVILTLSLLLTVLPSWSFAAPPEAPPSVPPGQDIETSPVIIDHITLFFVRGIRAYPPKERAQNISKRIEQVAADKGIQTDSIIAVEADKLIIGQISWLAAISSCQLLMLTQQWKGLQGSNWDQFIFRRSRQL